jgi:hypothetical protein
MRVWINAARHDELPARVEDLGTRGCLQIYPDRFDDTVCA